MVLHNIEYYIVSLDWEDDFWHLEKYFLSSFNVDHVVSVTKNNYEICKEETVQEKGWLWGTNEVLRNVLDYEIVLYRHNMRDGSTFYFKEDLAKIFKDKQNEQ